MTVRKLTVIALATLGLVAGTTYADASPDAPAPTSAVTTAAAPAADAPKPSDELSDPLTDPAGAYADLVAVKQKGGWTLLALGILVVLARVLTRIPGAIGAWFGGGARATIVAAVAAISVAAFDALALGGTWAGVAIAAAGALLALWNPIPPPTKQTASQAHAVAGAA